MAMKKFYGGVSIAGLLTLLIFSSCHVKTESSIIQDFFELRIYEFSDESQEAQLDEFLQNAFLPGLKRDGIEDIGVFKFVPELRDSLKQVFVLYPIRSSAHFGRISETLFADSVFRKKAEHFLNAPHDAPPYERLQVVLLKPFKDMPFLRPSSLEGTRDKRVYELRSYESPTESLYRNKVEMFNEGGEIELFEKLGFNAVFYGDVLAGARMPNLMYMTTFRDMETRDSLWNVFFDSPEWKALIDNPYYADNVNKADILLLTPTPYSDY